ncbi:hypothetical protein HG530_004201 [Fusarium avenaceum]|nr:hypothetical protein HG530_004201 [Fusarium avenaceum]
MTEMRVKRCYHISQPIPLCKQPPFRTENIRIFAPDKTRSANSVKALTDLRPAWDKEAVDGIALWWHLLEAKTGDGRPHP